MNRLTSLSLLLGLAACGGAASSEPDAVGAAADAPTATIDAAGNPTDAARVVAVDIDFEEAVPGSVNIGDGVVTPSQLFAPLGPPGNTFGDTFLRSATGNTVIVTSDLPAHTTISLSFLFAAIDSLDGSGSFPAGDYMRITVDDVEVFRESFANATPEQVQSYVSAPGVELARHEDLGFQGPGGYYTDSAYDMGQEPRFQNIPHTATSAVIAFTLEGEGVQTVEDESWAVDNLRVTLD